MTLFTSDYDKKRSFKTSLAYLGISLFCILFGAVYELYSHEVYSYYMIYAFVFPLCFGTLPFMICCAVKNFKMPGRISFNIYNAGIGTLTVGSIVKGVLDIYGTTNELVSLYFGVGAIFVFAGIVTYMFDNT